MVKYILLVDVNENQHIFFQHVIETVSHRFRLLSAYDGQSGLRIFRKVRPACVFVNFNLNDTSGLACLNKMRSLKGADKLPLYLFSSVYNIQLASIAKLASGYFSMDSAVNSLRNALIQILNTPQSQSMPGV